MKKILSLFKPDAISFADRREIIKRERARYGLQAREINQAAYLSLADKINGLMAYNSLKQV